MSVRTLFLAVRGTYQAGLAMRMARDDLNKLEGEQKKVIKQAELMLQKSQQWLFAGTAFASLGVMIGRSMMQLLEASTSGRIALGAFSERVQMSMRRLSEAMTPIMTFFFDIIATVLEFATTHPVLINTIALLLALAAPILIVGGFLLVLKGAIGIIVSTLTIMYGKVMLTTASMMALGSATVYAFGVFISVYSVLQKINSPIASLTALIIGLAIALWGLFVAQTAVTGGLNLLMAGGAIAAAGAISLAEMSSTKSSIPSYQTGTTFVRQGGIANLHGGEEIISAREKRVVSKIEKASRQTMGEGGGVRSLTNITIPIENLNTKANFDDVDRKLSRVLRDAMDNKF